MDQVSPSKCIFRPRVSHSSLPLSHMTLSRARRKVLERKRETVGSMYDPQNNQSKRKEGGKDGSVLRAQGKTHRKQQKQVGIQTRTPPPVSCLEQRTAPNPVVSDVRSLASSPLVEEPARPLVRALGRAFLALHPVCQTCECGHASSLTGSAGVRSTAAAKRFSDAAEWVVREVGLGGCGA